jgi:pimeloyl-ACP methyl ester carboxylesterase
MLASHGWTVLRYDRQETLVDYLDDETCAEGIVDIIDWAASDALIRRLADTRTVYLIGHSRGGKLAALASSRDRRVKGLFLIDPVDYHPVYQPISPGFPSSIAALQQSESPVSVAVVGSGRAGDCAPEASNFNRFFEASTGRALSIEVEQAGHFAFLDDQPLQSLVCPGSDIASGESGVFDPQTAGILARAVMVAWGELLTSSQEQVVGKSPEEKPRLPSVLPTWSTRDLPQFQEDTLGPRATQEEKSRALEAQKRAIEGRRRFTSGQASGQVPSSEQVLSDGQITEVVDAERIADDLKALINETKKGGAWRGELKLKGFNHGS